MNTGTTRATAILILAIAIIAGGYFYQNRAMNALSNAAATTTVTGATSTTPTFAAVSSVSSDGRGSTNIVPIANTDASIKVPDYKKPLTITASASAGMSASAKDALMKSYAKTQAVLLKDPMQFNEWIFLGNDNLIAGNYDTARQYWEYVSARWPSNVASFNNLGDLYMNYLHDYPKAEKNWLQAIVNKPDDTNPYRNLFTLYSDTSYKPTNTAAEDILKKGIAAMPKAVDLQYMLAKWYQKLGRTQEATAMFQKAIDTANSQGQTQLAAQIKIDAGIK